MSYCQTMEEGSPLIQGNAIRLTLTIDNVILLAGPLKYRLERWPHIFISDWQSWCVSPRIAEVFDIYKYLVSVVLTLFIFRTQTKFGANPFLHNGSYLVLSRTIYFKVLCCIFLFLILIQSCLRHKTAIFDHSSSYFSTTYQRFRVSRRQFCLLGTNPFWSWQIPTFAFFPSCLEITAKEKCLLPFPRRPVKPKATRLNLKSSSLFPVDLWNLKLHETEPCQRNLKNSFVVNKGMGAKRHFARRPCLRSRLGGSYTQLIKSPRNTDRERCRLKWIPFCAFFSVIILLSWFLAFPSFILYLTFIQFFYFFRLKNKIFLFRLSPPSLHIPPHTAIHFFIIPLAFYISHS